LNRVDKEPIKQEIFNTPYTKNLLLVDRDGTLNFDEGYTHETQKLEIRWNIVSILIKLVSEHTKVACITNQSGVNRGFFGIEDVFSFNSTLAIKLKERNFPINAFYICPHMPTEFCDCRKPKPKMLLSAIEYYQVDPKLTTFVGNSSTDELAGFNAGVKYISVHDTNFENQIKLRWAELSAY
jgi:D,D-heptose 1,7-bisphosphate phosphatase